MHFHKCQFHPNTFLSKLELHACDGSAELTGEAVMCIIVCVSPPYPCRMVTRTKLLQSNVALEYVVSTAMKTMCCHHSCSNSCPGWKVDKEHVERIHIKRLHRRCKSILANVMANILRKSNVHWPKHLAIGRKKGTVGVGGVEELNQGEEGSWTVTGTEPDCDCRSEWTLTGQSLVYVCM